MGACLPPHHMKAGEREGGEGGRAGSAPAAAARLPSLPRRRTEREERGQAGGRVGGGRAREPRIVAAIHQSTNDGRTDEGGAPGLARQADRRGGNKSEQHNIKKESSIVLDVDIDITCVTCLPACCR